MVYLDHNATTPLHPRAREAMLPFLGGEFGNPSSIHGPGRAARAAVDEARERLAGALRVRPHELIFTSGGTEANNLAVIGLARQFASKGRHLITSPTEHHAVLHAFEALQKREGFELTLLPVDTQGRVDADDLRRAIRTDTILASVMSANNETGVLQDVRALAAVCRERGVLFHSDVVQSFGKEPVHPNELGLDAAAVAAHKCGGPKGVGALFLRAGLPLRNILHGGAHENQRRPGTENVAAIAGFGAAVRELEPTPGALRPLREQLWQGIRGVCPDAVRNTPEQDALDNTLNVSFPGADGETLLIALDLEGVCASSGSACMVGSVEPSHVLLAMGAPPELARATIRFSLGKETSAQDMEFAVRAFAKVWRRHTANNQQTLSSIHAIPS